MASNIPFVKRRKQTEDEAAPILLIGSRADTHSFEISAKDWDLILPHSTLITLFTHHFNQFSWLSVQRDEFPKIKGRLLNGQVIEIEVVENYASTQLLYTEKFFSNDWRQYDSKSFGVGQFKLKIAAQNALLALKYSTCFFPVNWTKNIHQLVEMKKRMGCKSFDELFATQDLRQLITLRSRETLARCKHFKQIVRKQILTQQDVDNANIARTFELYNTAAPDCVDFPLTGIKLDKAKFLVASEDHKRILVAEQLTLLEHYFASYGARRAPQLALEAFITQSVPPNWYEDLNELMTKTHCIYSKSAYRTPELQNRLDNYEYDEIFEAEFLDQELYKVYLKEELPKHRAPLASEQDLAESAFSNGAITWAMDHIEEFFDRPAVNIPQLSHVTINPPSEVWYMIASHIDDHITLAAFEQVCRATTHAVSWKNLVLNCWSETDLEKHREAMAVPHPNWKLIFRAVYESFVHRKLFMCVHCGGNHFELTAEEWDKYDADRRTRVDTEAYDYFCYCPLCDVGSWSSCSQHPQHYVPQTQPSRCLVQ